MLDGGGRLPVSSALAPNTCVNSRVRRKVCGTTCSMIVTGPARRTTSNGQAQVKSGDGVCSASRCSTQTFQLQAMSVDERAAVGRQQPPTSAGCGGPARLKKTMPDDDGRRQRRQVQVGRLRDPWARPAAARSGTGPADRRSSRGSGSGSSRSCRPACPRPACSDGGRRCAGRGPRPPCRARQRRSSRRPWPRRSRRAWRAGPRRRAAGIASRKPCVSRPGRRRLGNNPRISWDLYTIWPLCRHQLTILLSYCIQFSFQRQREARDGQKRIPSGSRGRDRAASFGRASVERGLDLRASSTAACSANG